MSLDSLQVGRQYSQRGYTEADMQTLAAWNQNKQPAVLDFTHFKQNCLFDEKTNYITQHKKISQH